MMKRVKLLSLFLASVLLLALFAGVLTGCSGDTGAVFPFATSGSATDDSANSPVVTGISLESGSIIVTYSDGSRVNLGSSVTNVTENTINVSVTDTDSTAVAASRALLSTVCVICKFTKNVTYRTMFGGYFTQQEQYASAGAGVIYQLDKTSGDAYLITNQHVVYDSDSNTSDHVSDDINIYLYGSTQAIPATYVGGSANYDIAVLKVTGDPTLRASAAEAAKISDSSLTQVGSTALVVGNPEGSGISTTLGVVSVDSEYITMTAVDNSGDVSFRVIRVDAAVNSGNSGGGLFNGSGELIGIVNAKVNSTSVENIGYAIPSNVAVAIAQNIIDYGTGSVRRAMLGITLTATDAAMVYDETTATTSIRETVKVNAVESGRLGDIMGLSAGDVILSVQVGARREMAISRQYQLIDELLNARVGDTVTLVIRKSGAADTTIVFAAITEDCLENY